MANAHRHTTRDALLWLGVYIAAVTLPLFALLVASERIGRGWAWDFAMALGYAGLAMLCVQFALTARFRRARAPFGIDIIYYFHRYLALLALALVLFVAVSVLSLARLTHAALTTLGLALALGHLAGSGRYLDSAWKQAL